MPNLEEHCKRTQKRYGVEGRDIHEWLDTPSRKYGGAHRQFRHDTETIRLVGEIFGKKYGKSLSENIALDHIMSDHEEEIRKRRTVVVKFPEKKEIPSIPCSYCNTLLKPSDQFCPSCGASRKRIIEEFDRVYEMEKIKLQEKRKRLRKELKHELALGEKTPEERIALWKEEERIAREYGVEISELPRYDPVLEKLVQEDFKRHPELEERFHEEMAEKTRAEERKENLRILLGFLVFLFLVLIPSVYLWVVIHWLWGAIWFFSSGIASLICWVALSQTVS